MDLRELLGEELYTQVMDKVGNEHKIAVVSDGNWFPKEKFDAVNNDNKELKTQLKDRDKQLEDLGKKATGNEELQNQIQQLQEENQKVTQEYESKIQQQAFDFALERSLSSAKARNPKAVKALLDTDSLKMDGDKLLGLDEQLKSLRESDAYLFEEADGSDQGDKKPAPTFSQGSHQKSDQSTVDQWVEAFKPQN